MPPLPHDAAIFAITACGCLNRIDTDLAKQLANDILLPAVARNPNLHKIHVIPADQIMAHFVGAGEKCNGVDNIPDRFALFAKGADGNQDPIQFSDHKL